MKKKKKASASDWGDLVGLKPEKKEPVQAVTVAATKTPEDENFERCIAWATGGSPMSVDEGKKLKIALSNIQTRMKTVMLMALGRRLQRLGPMMRLGQKVEDSLSDPRRIATSRTEDLLRLKEVLERDFELTMKLVTEASKRGTADGMDGLLSESEDGKEAVAPLASAQPVKREDLRDLLALVRKELKGRRTERS